MFFVIYGNMLWLCFVFGQIDIIENGCHIIQYLVLKQEQINLLTENINNMFAILLSTYNGENLLKSK